MSPGETGKGGAHRQVWGWRDSVEAAKVLGDRGRFQELRDLCRELVARHANDAEALNAIGTLAHSFGLLTVARVAYMSALALQPNTPGTLCSLAILARDLGQRSQSRRLYEAIIADFPNHALARSNQLVGLDYDPELSDEFRLQAARAWGDWAVSRVGGMRPRPARDWRGDRPLRVGYVSADLRHHAVGLLVRHVLAAHERTSVVPFAYRAGGQEDWVSNEIKKHCVWRDVTQLDDAGLAEQVRQDGIDVLIDLSGHTGGTRLTAFALRPAPVQVSWLGYLATTGLECMDAVLLDDAHAPPGTEAQFTERVVRLAHGRLCFQPPAFAPATVAAPPHTTSGHITWGCFNNTRKLNSGVYDLWARILSAVPGSRLLLKWTSLNSGNVRQGLRAAFAARGIDPARIEFRGRSSHQDLLSDYADIDIALDPFPFTGGVTSCETLWMGVPVVTWPQSRVVSRQTYAMLASIGLPELAARDADDYVRISCEVASDHRTRGELRATLRERMRESPLMDIVGFTRGLETALRDLYLAVE